ncbi:MAG TPA: hydroxymethylbilane synthase [Gemmatimonadales bacterium]
MSRRLRLGTRGSRLARWQAEWVRDHLSAAGHEAELVEISTTGDALTDVPLSDLGASDSFTRQIDEALLGGRVDLAVHSLKDLPTTLPDGITLAAVSRREDPRDALVGRGPLRLDQIPVGAVIATCSLRRRAQLLRARPDLTLVDIRGNIETRLAKLDQNPVWTATILAVAGLARLGLSNRIGERLDPALMLPAPGQGALAVTARANDPSAGSAARQGIHHAATAVLVSAERAVLHHLDSGCHAPVAALAQDGGTEGVHLFGRVLSLNGEQSVEANMTAPVGTDAEARALGASLAEHLLELGAAELLPRSESVES